jgi:hypothetical protein
MAKGPMVTPRFILEEKPKMGWRYVFLANAAGMLLSTEPVCSFPVDEHPWFAKWILEQRVPVELPDVATDRKALNEKAKEILDKDKKK